MLPTFRLRTEEVVVSPKSEKQKFHFLILTASFITFKIRCKRTLKHHGAIIVKGGISSGAGGVA